MGRAMPLPSLRAFLAYKKCETYLLHKIKGICNQFYDLRITLKQNKFIRDGNYFKISRTIKNQ
jgi:hypothetical protein